MGPLRAIASVQRQAAPAGRAPWRTRKHERALARHRADVRRPATVGRRYRRHRHRHRGHHRHAGPAGRQAHPRALLRRRGAGPRHRGLQLPARRRRRHEHRRRVRDVVVEVGVRGLRDAPGPQHVAAAPVAAGHGAGVRRRAVARPLRRGGLPAADPAPPAGPPLSGRHAGLRRHRARVHRVQGHVRARVDHRLPRHDAGQPLQRRLLDPGRHPGRAPAAQDSARNGRRGHDGRVGQGRVQLRPARDRVQVRRRAGHLRQPRALQARG